MELMEEKTNEERLRNVEKSGVCCCDNEGKLGDWQRFKKESCV
jgi:hypothetical protein